SLNVYRSDVCAQRAGEAKTRPADDRLRRHRPRSGHSLWTFPRWSEDSAAAGYSRAAGGLYTFDAWACPNVPTQWQFGGPGCVQGTQPPLSWLRTPFRPAAVVESLSICRNAGHIAEVFTVCA